MKASEAKELALKTPKGWLHQINEQILRVAAEGAMVTTFHLPDKMETSKVKEIMSELEKDGFTVKHITYAYESDANILDIFWS